MRTRSLCKSPALVCAVSIAALWSLAGAADVAPVVKKAPAPAQAEAERDYVRYVGDNQRGKLETVIVTMLNPSGAKVDLIGAVHIADSAYYKALTQVFTGYEALLFELVDGQSLKGKKAAAEKAAKASDEHDEEELEGGKGKRNPALAILGAMMQGLGSYLRLEYQTDGIDYHTKNFVHADVSMDEFVRLQAEKGESFMTLFQKAFEAQLGQGAQAGQEPTGGQLLLALLGDSSGIKVAMARMLDKAESIGEKLGFGPDSVIVGERNRVALEVLDREVKAGRKNLGLFYGAAHLPDLERRMEERGFRRSGERWLTAWDIKPRAAERKDAAAEKKP